MRALYQWNLWYDRYEACIDAAPGRCRYRRLPTSVPVQNFVVTFQEDCSRAFGDYIKAQSEKPDPRLEAARRAVWAAKS